MKAVILSSLKQGSYFRLKDSESAPLWVRSCYDRTTKMYEILPYDNINVSRFRRGTLVVYVEN